MTTTMIDVDFWAKKATLPDIAPYLSRAWREWMRLDEQPPPLPESQYFVQGEALTAAAGTEEPLPLVKERLNALGKGLAVLNPGVASGVSGYANPRLAADMAHAANEWTRTWLDGDPRLRGSIVVTPRDPGLAAQEIRRAGADPRMRQVLLSYPQFPLGHRAMFPVYEAACELGIPVTLEASGAYSGSNRGITAICDPVSTFEALLGWEHAGQPHLTSVLTSGVLDRFPQLRLVFSGFGVAWLPSILWRLDHEYRTRRVARPAALSRLPSEYVEEHVRLTTSVLELPANPAQLVALLAAVGGERLLVFGSGPLGDADGRTLLDAVDDGWARKIASENADAHYALGATAAA